MMTQSQREDHRWHMARKNMQLLWHMVKSKNPNWSHAQVSAEIVRDLHLPNSPRTFKQRRKG